MKPFGTAWLPIFLKDHERKGFSGEKVSIKIKHNFEGFFQDLLLVIFMIAIKQLV